MRIGHDIPAINEQLYQEDANTEQFFYVVSLYLCLHIYVCLYKYLHVLTMSTNHLLTLSERLWTSAARDLFAGVGPRTCFFTSADSNSASYAN